MHRLIVVLTLLSLLVASCGVERDAGSSPKPVASVGSGEESDSTDGASEVEGSGQAEGGTSLVAPATTTTAAADEVAATVTFDDGSTVTILHGEINTMLDELEAESGFVDTVFRGTVPPGFSAEVLTRNIIIEGFRIVLDGVEVDLSAGKDDVTEDLVELLVAVGGEAEAETEAESYYENIGYVRLVAEHLSNQRALVDHLAESGPKGSLTPCVSHILVETEAEADDLMAQLADGADFGELAIEHSTGPSGPNGGELGCAPSTGYVEPFANAVDAAELGVPSGPVETTFGWHVLVVTSYDALSFTYESVNAVLADATIEVDERVGTWDPTRSVVVAKS